MASEWKRHLNMASFAQGKISSAVRAETETRSHLFKVFGYSLTKGIGLGKSIDSDVFTVGGYDWRIRYYPYGFGKGFLSMYLDLVSAAQDVRAEFHFNILQQNGAPLHRRRCGQLKTFNSTNDKKVTRCWGYGEFVERNKFEASECLKDDAFTVCCTVSVWRNTKLWKEEEFNPFGVDIPPSTLNQNLANILESGQGADVRFLVKGEEFNAHRCVLAARSSVFNAMLFGCMKEKWTDTIRIDEIEAPVFKAVLHFIYSDSLSSLELEGKQDLRLMAEHVLVAADRFALERLRLMCEDILGKSLSASNAATTMILAERHNCRQLKAQCLKLMSLPEIFKEVALTSEFQDLMNIYPSVLEDLKSLKNKMMTLI